MLALNTVGDPDCLVPGQVNSAQGEKHNGPMDKGLLESERIPSSSVSGTKGKVLLQAIKSSSSIDRREIIGKSTSSLSS